MADLFKKVFKKEEKEGKGGSSSPRRGGSSSAGSPTQGGTSSPRHGSPSGRSSRSKEELQEPAQEKLTKDDFESLDVLGKGSFANVVLAKRISTGKFFAMKIVNKEGLLKNGRVQDVFTERNVLTRSTHPYLMKLHHTFQTDHKLFFVMDYMPGGDLDHYLNSFPGKTVDTETARLYAAEMFLAITYLHDHGVIYRDLKPENILLDREGHCALADFGLSKDFHREGQDLTNDAMRANSFVGSPFYVAPDVLKQKEYTTAVDFWSFGILMFRLLGRRAPFNGRNMKEVFDNILFSDLRFPTSTQVAPDAQDLISRLLVKDASKRAKADEVRNHPYWNGLDWQDVMDRKVAPKHWKVLPTVEETLAAKQAHAASHPPPPGKEAPKQPAQVVNTPATASQLQNNQQQMFQGFSHTADSMLGGQ